MTLKYWTGRLGWGPGRCGGPPSDKQRLDVPVSAGKEREEAHAGEVA